MTYYLKYRPQNLGELDQDGVRESLTKIVKSGQIPHALLFSGPKGTGKTSAARIIAKIVNCESPKGGNPCNKCEQCVSISKGQNLDVIELDAASHRGIEDVRQIRDAVKLAPAKANKKVYIIDEAHMLTTEASNALLKTLEEPPEHVMFILCTTNPEKLIDTIRSRVTNIVFKKATIKEIVKSLLKIAKGEGIKVENSALEIIASASGGSFRDATKIFEQLVNEGVDLNAESVEEVLSTRKSFDVSEFLKVISNKDTKRALNLIDVAVQKGALAREIIGVIIEKLRGYLLGSVGLGESISENFSKEELITLVSIFSEAYAKTQYAFIEQMPLEVAVIKWCENGKNGKDDSRMEKASGRFERSSIKSRDSEDLSKPEEKAQVRNDGESEKKQLGGGDGDGVVDGNGATSAVGVLTGTISEDVWHKVLSAIRPGHASTEALLRAARPLEFNGSTLKIGVYYKFHKEHLEEEHHRGVLEKALSTYLGNSVRVVCTLTEPPVRKVETSQDGDGNQSDVVLTELEGEDLGVKPSLTSEGGEDIISIAEKIFGN
jgi:DNA polymerase-3 subunit gamma/tau